MAKRPSPRLNVIYKVADLWVQQALRSHGSLFTPGRSIWSLSNIEELYGRTHGNPQTSKKEDFETKFRRQLEGATSDIYQLAAEELAVYCLVSWEHALTARRKREMVSEVLGWGASAVQIPQVIQASFETGLVHPGTAYNTKKPMQLWFLLDVVRMIKSLAADQRDATLTDPLRLRDLVFSLEVEGAQTTREAVLHLILPDFYEAITSREDKKRLVAAFADYVPDKSLNVDQQIAAIRDRLAPANPPDFDFYAPGIKERWKPGKQPPPEVAEGGVRGSAKPFFVLNSVGQVPDARWKDIEGVEYEFGRDVTSAKALADAGAGNFIYYRTTNGAKDYPAMTFFGTGRIERVERIQGNDAGLYRAVIADYESFVRPVPQQEFRPSGWNHQHSIAVISQSDFEEILRRGQSIAPSQLQEDQRAASDFDIAALRSAALARGFEFPESLFGSIIAALQAHKHIVLTGAPGTGKTSLAHLVAEVATSSGKCSGFVPTTATADWTTYDTIGGLKPVDGGTLAFSDGHFLTALRRGDWLVIDELNRSNFDRAFGQLFTVLSGQVVVLPYEDAETKKQIAIVPEGVGAPFGTMPITVPHDWRILATMNEFDKSLLFEMSFALMRRFAFIQVAPPEDAVYRTLMRNASADEDAAELVAELLPLRMVKELGPALFIDAARYVAEKRRILPETPRGELLFEAFYSYFLPQFEGTDDSQGRHLFKTLRSTIGATFEERLRRVLVDTLGIRLVKAGSQDDDDEADADPGNEDQ